MKKALLYGLLASMFFALTFILNRSMNLGGGYWLWSASLRYLFMLPMLWLLCSVYALVTHGLPSSGQVIQSVSVALFSGVIATLLFFEATNLVRHNPKQLAVVEATQAGEVLFTLLGESCSSTILCPPPPGCLESASW